MLAVSPVGLVAVSAIVVFWPRVEGFFKWWLARLDRQDQKEEETARAGAPQSRSALLHMMREEAQQKLHGPLYKEARIALGMAERRGAVERPLRTVQHRVDQPDRVLNPRQPIAQIYRQLNKQLLILGEPGAGKTTLLMELTVELLDEAERSADQPMPVVFDLSTWTVKPVFRTSCVGVLPGDSSPWGT